MAKRTPDPAGPAGDNPFERYDIDPLKGPAAITERMRELVEETDDLEEKNAIRRAWEQLTMHPADRLKAALGAHPDSHGASGAAPPRPPGAPRESSPLTLEDLALRPTLLSALSPETEETDADSPLSDDPVLNSY